MSVILFLTRHFIKQITFGRYLNMYVCTYVIYSQNLYAGVDFFYENTHIIDESFRFINENLPSVLLSKLSHKEYNTIKTTVLGISR